MPAQILIMVAIYLISFKKKKWEKEEWFQNLSTLLIYSIATLPVIIPISDKVHVVIGGTITFIAFIYLIYISLKKIQKKPNKLNDVMKIYIDAVAKILLVISIFYSLYNIFSFVKNEERRLDLMHYKNIIIDENLYNRIKEVEEFINNNEAQGKKVYILDAMSAVYTIPANKYYKNYDMFNLGNLGKEGEERYYKGYKKYEK